MTQEIAEMTGWEPPATFDSLMSDPALDKVAGADEVYNKDNKDELIGVPFIVTRVSFNYGQQGEFASLECVTQDNRIIVINDGGTGIRRQMVSYLKALGLVDPGEGSLVKPNPLDKPFDAWASGSDAAHEGFKVKLLCKRGLRRSDYDAEGDRPAGTTYYLA